MGYTCGKFEYGYSIQIDHLMIDEKIYGSKEIEFLCCAILSDAVEVAKLKFPQERLIWRRQRIGFFYQCCRLSLLCKSTSSIPLTAACQVAPAEPLHSDGWCLLFCPSVLFSTSVWSCCLLFLHSLSCMSSQLVSLPHLISTHSWVVDWIMVRGEKPQYICKPYRTW